MVKTGRERKALSILNYCQICQTLSALVKTEVEYIDDDGKKYWIFEYVCNVCGTTVYRSGIMVGGTDDSTRIL